MAENNTRTLGVREPRTEGPLPRERRRRAGDTQTAGLKLPIPDWVRDKYPEREFVYYWATGSAQRLHDLTKNDWYAAEGGEGGRLPGAADRSGNPVDHVLMVKYRDYYEQDRGERETLRKQTEEQMKRGPIAGSGDDAGAETLSSDVSYASPSNRVR